MKTMTGTISTSALPALLLLFVTAVVCTAAVNAAARTLTLADSGESFYSIAIPENAAPAEEYAAEELAAYLEKITGATFPVINGIESKPAVPGRLIALGNSLTAQGIIGNEELESAGSEGFIIRTGGDNIAIRGATAAGTLNGVYSFLEDVLGVRWYTPVAEFVPEQERLEIEPLEYSQKPAFEYRESFFHFRNGDWAARNRLNGSSYRFAEKHGGQKIKYFEGFVHTFFSLVPPGEYFDVYPEYFGMIGGSRSPKGQLCLTNPEVLEIVTRKVLDKAERTKGRRAIISVSQNDNILHCQCPRCRAMNEKEGSPAGTLLRFVNSVADAVAVRYPNVEIDTLAYQYTEDVPKITRPRPNVNVRLCHMAPCCDLHPLGKCFWNDKFVRNLKAWAAVTDRLYVWDYFTNFRHYMMPFPNLNSVTADVAFLRDNRVRGLFAQGSYESPGGDMAELKAWMFAKLMWNPDRDADALIRDFARGYYGPAAKPVYRYILAQNRHVRSHRIHAHLYSNPRDGFLDADLLDIMDKHLSDAESAAAGSTDYADRVKLLRTNYMYVQLAAPDLFRPGAAPAGKEEFSSLFQRFKSNLEYFGIDKLREFEAMATTLENMEKSSAF